MQITVKCTLTRVDVQQAISEFLAKKGLVPITETMDRLLPQQPETIHCEMNISQPITGGLFFPPGTRNMIGNSNDY